jgi:hypothetical protein
MWVVNYRTGIQWLLWVSSGIHQRSRAVSSPWCERLWKKCKKVVDSAKVFSLLIGITKISYYPPCEYHAPAMKDEDQLSTELLRMISYHQPRPRSLADLKQDLTNAFQANQGNGPRINDRKSQKTYRYCRPTTQVWQEAWYTLRVTVLVIALAETLALQAGGGRIIGPGRLLIWNGLRYWRLIFLNGFDDLQSIWSIIIRNGAWWLLAFAAWYDLNIDHIEIG